MRLLLCCCVLLAACASRAVRCDAHLQPINPPAHIEPARVEMPLPGGALERPDAAPAGSP